MLDASKQSPACDREVFAQVWQRVSPGEGGPVEVLPPDRGAGGADQGQALQSLVLTCLSDAGAYRDLARRARASAGVLNRLARDKIGQARRLSAAYFLLSGVRYWPGEAATAGREPGFFSALRRRYLAEGELAGALAALAGQVSDPRTAGLCRELTRETLEMAQTVRDVVEREM